MGGSELSALTAIKETLQGLFDQGDEIDEIYPYEEDEPGEEIVPVKETKGRNLSSVRAVSSINSRGYEVMVVSPKSFDESLEISKNLIDRKTVVLNLELLDHEQSQRIVDFLAGATYALNGHQQKIGEGVFIFTPNNVNISAEQEKKVASSIADAFWNQVK